MERRIHMTKHGLLDKADIALDVVILLVAGMMMLIAGVLLFPISRGMIPYYENGLYGLLLFIFALQAAMLGKTPFGDRARSRRLLVVWTAIASVGIVTCFVPGAFAHVPRILLFVCFGPGGLALLLQMLFAEDKLRSWVRHGGILRHLALACGSVYVLSILVAVLVWRHSSLATQAAAIVVLPYGLSIICLALVLQKVYRRYPQATESFDRDSNLAPDKVMMLMTGFFMLILGVLLVPVSLGILPFSASAQLGLLVIILAIQMIAFGNTPIGAFPRSWLLVLFGSVFAALGIISCIVPGVLVPCLTLIVATLNILGGVIGVKKACAPLLKKSEQPGEPLPRILVSLCRTQLTMNVLSILFGASMLISGFIPALAIGVILAANGCLLLFLLRILIILERMQRNAETAA